MVPGSTTVRLVSHTKRRYHAPSVPIAPWNMGEAVIRLSDSIAPRLARRAFCGFRIEQAVQVNDEIAHMGVVDSLLCLRFPDRICRGVVWIDADDFDFVEILEFSVVDIGAVATEH